MLFPGTDYVCNDECDADLCKVATVSNVTKVAVQLFSGGCQFDLGLLNVIYFLSILCNTLLPIFAYFTIKQIDTQWTYWYLAWLCFSKGVLMLCMLILILQSNYHITIMIYILVLLAIMIETITTWNYVCCNYL